MTCRADWRGQIYVAAIDPGNTKTVVAVADGWGRVRGYTPEARSELRNTLPHSTYFAT